MKRTFALASAILLFLTVSCSKNEVGEKAHPMNITFNIVDEEEDTKVSMNRYGSEGSYRYDLTWESGDVLFSQYFNGGEFFLDEFSLQSGGGSHSGKFRCSDSHISQVGVVKFTVFHPMYSSVDSEGDYLWWDQSTQTGKLSDIGKYVYMFKVIAMEDGQYLNEGIYTINPHSMVIKLPKGNTLVEGLDGNATAKISVSGKSFASVWNNYHEISDNSVTVQGVTLEDGSTTEDTFFVFACFDNATVDVTLDLTANGKTYTWSFPEKMLSVDTVYNLAQSAMETYGQ